MNIRQSALALALSAAFAVPALAQTTGSEVQRNVNQQDRIEQGLKSGELSTKEAARLEKGEAKIEKTESHALKDGTLTPAEKAKIQREQNAESAAIHKAKTNDVKGNPNSASSQRMQADVQRQSNQQARIKEGVKSGELTKHETAKLEAGEAKVSRKEARAGANGHVGATEQAGIQHAENKQSAKIYQQKHDAQKKPE
jgi:hypothetical protein